MPAYMGMTSGWDTSDGLSEEGEKMMSGAAVATGEALETITLDYDPTVGGVSKDKGMPTTVPVATPPPTSTAQAGMSPVVIAGGLLLAYLIFGGKKSKKRR